MFGNELPALRMHFQMFVHQYVPPLAVPSDRVTARDCLALAEGRLLTLPIGQRHAVDAGVWSAVEALNELKSALLTCRKAAGNRGELPHVARL